MENIENLLNTNIIGSFDLNSEEITVLHNGEKPENIFNGKKRKSNSRDEIGSKRSRLSSEREEDISFKRDKSDNFAHPHKSLRSSNESSLVTKSSEEISTLDKAFLGRNNSIASDTSLLNLNLDKIASFHDIDINFTPSKTQIQSQAKNSHDDSFSCPNEDLMNLTQCLKEVSNGNKMNMSQAQNCIKKYQENGKMSIAENQTTASVFFQKKEQVKGKPFIGSDNKEGLCGLTTQQKKFLLHTKGIEDLYDWQYECLGLPTVRNKQNLIYALPTSGGKSLVAEVLILRELLVYKKNVILLLPFVSIVQEKIQDLVPFALQWGFLIEEYCAGRGTIPPTKRREKRTLYVATTEKCQILIDSLIENKRMEEIGLVVVDELHMIGDKQRGHNLELLISKFMFLTSKKLASIEIIGMSATIENINEVAKFINADLYVRDFRPVELKEFIKMGENLFYIDQKAKSVEETFKLEKANVGDNFDAQRRTRDPDHISYFTEEILNLKSSCLIFCASKKSCENVALLLSDVLPREYRQQNRDEKKDLIETMKLDSGGKICDTLLKTIPFGVSYHHSGLTADERRRVEDAFRSGIINVICCTSTLAAGVNLPAGRVIIRSPNIGRDFIPLSTYKQMIGRAGRAGKSTIGDSILICNKKDHQQVVTLLTSKMDYTISNYITNPSFFQPMILNLLANKLVKTYEGIQNFLEFTLANVQRCNYESDIFECVKDTIQSLYDEGAIEHNFTSLGLNSPFLEFVRESDGKQIAIYPDDELVISKMGQAAVNSGKSLLEAHNIDADLQKATESLVLKQSLHLLYIAVPKDIITSININYRTFSEIFFEMERHDKSIVQTAKVIGISMAQVAKMMISTVTYSEEKVYNIKRCYIAMMLLSLWNGRDIFDVARQFKVDRGIVSKLMNSASSEAYSIFKFCEVFEEYWIFRDIFEKFSKRLQHCCAVELLPLMELPAVKIGRAKMLYAAGIKSVMDVAALSPEEMTRTIKFINIQQATKVIKAAKYLVKVEFDDNREKLLDMKDVLNKKI